MFKLDHVTFAYPHQAPLIQDLTIGVPTGQLTCLVGPNGSGKSTLFKLLTRSQKPQSGTVTMDGQDVWAYSPREFARQVAIVHQHNPVYDEIKVRDLVAMGRLPYQSLLSDLPATDEKGEAILAELGLTDLVDRPLLTLSGGQQQLVWLAAALNQDAQAIFLDEPTT